MDFSIVIPAYNEAKYLPACIEHIKKQRGGFEFEIIVVDNNSTDETYKIAKDLNVKVIKEIRQGVGQARKTGTELAQGKYILHIDADTRLPKNYLLEVKKRFENDVDLVCVGGHFILCDAPWWKDSIWFLVRWFFWFFFYILAPRNRGPVGNNMTFICSVYNKTTGFDEHLKFGEDFDLCKKLSAFGKIKLDMKLKCHISARRFCFDHNLWFYFLNVVKMSFTGESYKNELPEHTK